jgi:eukaryotic-like serine/threonine-protein kinase
MRLSLPQPEPQSDGDARRDSLGRQAGREAWVTLTQQVTGNLSTKTSRFSVGRTFLRRRLERARGIEVLRREGDVVGRPLIDLHRDLDEPVVPCDPNSQANERQRLKEIAVSLTEERLESWYRTGIWRNAGGSFESRSAFAGRVTERGRTDRRRTRRGAPQGHRSSRSEASQCEDYAGGDGEGSRFRSREIPGGSFPRRSHPLRGTAPAVLLGTPGYLAPEQVQGRPVDRRADVWAFGVVLYEMVTGERLFRGESLHETIAAALTTDPRWERVPPAVLPLLRACLERDPLKRLRDVGDYQFLLARSEAVPASIRRSPVRSWAIATAALTALILAFLGGKSLSRDESASAAAAPIRFSTMLPAGVSVTRGPGYTSSVAVSPDGRTIVIAATEKDGQRLYHRSLDRLDFTPLAGTERGTSPFFSWDGEWIGFFADGRLKRIPAGGGASVDIAPAPGFSSGASWGPDDRIVFAYGADSHLHVIPAKGGSVEQMTSETPGRHPEVMPDGRTVLFESAGHIYTYHRQNRTITKLLPGTAPRYANGHVILSRGTTLLAARINLEDSSIGAAIPLMEGVAVELPGSGGGRHYAISRSGALVYVPAADAYELVVAGADGVEHVIGQPQRSLENPRFSPDGRHVVVASRRHDAEATELWLHDLRAGTATRLTSRGGRAPIWSDNGTITYSHLGERQGIYSTRVDGGGERTQLLTLNAFHWLVGWTPDRTTLLYGLMGAPNQSSIMAYSNTQSRTVVGPGSIWGGRLSRDGKWLAYYMLNSGTFEVYAMPFPEAGALRLIAEGTDPSWGA